MSINLERVTRLNYSKVEDIKRAMAEGNISFRIRAAKARIKRSSE
jgi:hypothetical protein